MTNPLPNKRKYHKKRASYKKNKSYSNSVGLFNLVDTLGAEYKLQIAFVKLLNLKYKELFHFYIPNDSKRSKTEGFVRKLLGLRRGMLDLVVMGKNKILFMEFKSKSGKLSKYQNDVIECLASRGFDHAVVNNLDDAIQALESYFYSEPHQNKILEPNKITKKIYLGGRRLACVQY